MSALGASLKGWLFGAKKLVPAQLLKDGVINARLIWLGLLGIMLLLVGGVYEPFASTPKQYAPVETAKSAPPVGRSYEDALESKLANLLSQVKGAGTVSVNILLETGGMQEPAKNITKETKTVQEKDNAGGIRTTTESKDTEQILLSKENGADRPVMVREYKPVIKGVLIVAEGANDSAVKANLTRAVEAGLGIPPYKITVLPQRK
ncbi:MAG: stage sporulation protein [Sporomusa sp.]|jgi:stage III sporulation protein AG|nr:stage sporulation protein [Sporomusa sp.]